MTAHTKGHKVVLGNSDPAFMKRGFRNCKKCGKRFLDNYDSLIYKDYEGILWLDEENVNEQFQEQLSLEKAENRQVLLTTLRNVQYIGRLGLPFRGNSEERKFVQLMQLSAKIDPCVLQCMERKRSKYFYGDYQNEIIRIMTFILLRHIAKNINESRYYSIMAEEVTDSSNVEQLVLCFRWVYADLYVHEDFVGIHTIENIKSNTIVFVVKDVLTRFNIPLAIVVSNVTMGQVIWLVTKRGFQAKFLKNLLWRP